MVSLLATRVAGLDEILGGGIPLRTMTLILGTPGAGKTILAAQERRDLPMVSHDRGA